jgi:hypothetical protein
MMRRHSASASAPNCRVGSLMIATLLIPSGIFDG